MEKYLRVFFFVTWSSELELLFNRESDKQISYVFQDIVSQHM